MLHKSITAKIKRNALTTKYVESTKSKLDVFLMADRITEEEFSSLMKLLDDNI